jgi:hypothetical protein
MTEPLPPIQPPPPPSPAEQPPDAVSEGSDPARSWPHRHRTPLVAAGVGLVAFGAGFAIAVSAFGQGSTSAAPSTPATSPAASPAAAAPHHPKQARSRATIVTESGTTWTARTPSGRTLTIVITPQTQFGTKAAPATAAQFPPGSTVIVAGTTRGSDLTASRIAAAPTPPSGSPTGTTS